MRRRDWPIIFAGLAGRGAHPRVGNELIGTVALGKRLLGDEPVGERARFPAQTITPALDLAQSVIASLDRPRVCYIEALVILIVAFKPAAVVERGCCFGHSSLGCAALTDFYKLLPEFPLGQRVFFTRVAAPLPGRIGRLFDPDELHQVAGLKHLREAVNEIVVGLHVFGAPHRRVAHQRVHLAPIGWDVFSLDAVRRPAALDIGTNLFLPLPAVSRRPRRVAQFFPKYPINRYVLRRLIDLARLFVILDPAQEHRAYRHAGLGADRPEILPVDEPRAYPDEDLPVVKDR